jgi:hypothetical protein
MACAADDQHHSYADAVLLDGSRTRSPQPGPRGTACTLYLAGTGNQPQ